MYNRTNSELCCTCNNCNGCRNRENTDNSKGAHCINSKSLVEAIKQMLSEIIAKEDKSKPLRDDIVVKIMCTSGMNISRRTVTKYRRIMKIPSAINRRER